VSSILSFIGILLLLAALSGVAFGVYMSADPKTREAGKLFAVWWVPAAAAASGVLMRDVVTFVVGTLCFLVAGAVFTFEGGKMQGPTIRRTGEKRDGSEKTTRENRARDDRAVS
jgi:phosphotransferase system  glucose/maltose/N-acetylglucosamine-specific IIC component